ncbi:hypothetical protein EZV62_003117 [Acer yangbiense]|uniref:RNase H type-1 domain-containing protein n=1 Tax=Acer yangbiense TaxID=1000413 RepID=A0A5C7IHD9_9ROSI|nr:hypothetical protein EZV62_003117 [Acer yangbiense]
MAQLKKALNLYRASDLLTKAKKEGKNIMLIDSGTGNSGIAVLNPRTYDSYPVDRKTFQLKKPDSNGLDLVHVLRQSRMSGFQISTILNNIARRRNCVGTILGVPATKKYRDEHTGHFVKSLISELMMSKNMDQADFALANEENTTAAGKALAEEYHPDLFEDDQIILHDHPKFTWGHLKFLRKGYIDAYSAVAMGNLNQSKQKKERERKRKREKTAHRCRTSPIASALVESVGPLAVAIPLAESTALGRCPRSSKPLLLVVDAFNIAVAPFREQSSQSLSLRFTLFLWILKLFRFCLSSLRDDELALLCIFWWRIWFLRNNNCHGKKGIGDDSLLAWCESFLVAFWDANQVCLNGVSAANPSIVVWKPPVEGTIKINCDAALDMNRGVVGFGLVVRDFGGVVLASCVQHIQVNFSPLIAEAMTILRGINLAFDSNLIPFVIKTDALAVVKLIEAKSPSLADIGLVIGEIVSKLDMISQSSRMMIINICLEDNVADEA